MHVLLSNDDGIDAPGLRALMGACEALGQVTVVAPVTEKSATAHGIKVHQPCALVERPELIGPGRAWALDANPADCVKYALSTLVSEDPPDLVISGINRGQNSGNNIIYSGTVAAASEAALYGFPAMAISLAAKWGEPVDFSTAARIALHLAPQVREAGFPEGTILNVNVPNLPDVEIQDLSWARQGHARFTDVWQPLTPTGEVHEDQPHVSNIGSEMSLSRDERDDDHLLARGHVTLTPLTHDRTHHGLLSGPPPFDLTLPPG